MHKKNEDAAQVKINDQKEQIKELSDRVKEQRHELSIKLKELEQTNALVTQKENYILQLKSESGDFEQNSVKLRERVAELEADLSTMSQKLKDADVEYQKLTREYESVLHDKKRVLELDAESRKVVEELEDKMKQDQQTLVDLK